MDTDSMPIGCNGYQMPDLYGEPVLNRLQELAFEHAAGYRVADPFPHAVIDNFLPESLLQEVLAAFPKPRALPNREFDDKHQVKLQYSDIRVLPPPVRELLSFLNSVPILGFLETLTEITGLVPDPYLEGGGLHQIERGGHLKVHADFNWHKSMRLDRRLNLLLYLNRDWREEYGGHFELWDRSMSRCVKKILPVFNRCVVFSTTDTSYHGHPNELTCPPERSRQSIALYYYTNGRPEEERSEAHSTLFRDRPGEVLKERNWLAKRSKAVAKALLPPIITHGLNVLTRKRG